MKITVLDGDTLGKDLDLLKLNEVGKACIYGSTSLSELHDRIKDTDVIIVNKLPLNSETLNGADNLKLICVAATGYDNIDTKYCASVGIQVSNVVGYSTNSVAQVTVATVLELATHLREYNNAVTSEKYTDSGLANMVAPIFYELTGKTWGVVGLGNIGKKVAEIAKAFGCRVIAHKRTPDESYECVSLDTLCRESDIISIHTPLTAQTRSLIGEKEIALMKKNVILYNAARGAVTDEEAVAEAIISGYIGAFGSDVFSEEPLPRDNPMFKIAKLPNVCLTPHMAWASSEARNLCLDEMIENIKGFQKGIRRNAVN